MLYYIKRKLHLIFFLYIYIQLTNTKLNQPYQTYQQLRTAGYFNQEHPIAGILVSIGKQILPKQPELRVKMFRQANQINVDRMKSCQIALCLPHTTYGSTLSCFYMSSNTFYQILQTSVSIPCHSVFTVVWLPTDPMYS